jgi:hypothetical protein
VAYQMLEGAVYYALALLCACFMAGLAEGTSIHERTPARRMLSFAQFLVGWTAAELLGLLWLFGAQVHGPAALAVFGLLLLGQGAAAGALFAAAAARMTAAGEVGRGAGRIYGIELAGSALGAVLVSALFLPVFGITLALAAALLAATALAGWLAVMAREAKSS